MKSKGGAFAEQQLAEEELRARARQAEEEQLQRLAGERQQLEAERMRAQVERVRTEQRVQQPHPTSGKGEDGEGGLRARTEQRVQQHLVQPNACIHMSPSNGEW